MNDQEQNVLDNASVFVTHLRVAAADMWGDALYTAHRLRELGVRPAAKGGMTLVQLELPDGTTIRSKARCSPRDNYCKAIGRQIALGRAVKAAVGLRYTV